MKNIKFILLLFLIGCATSKVITDYDSKVVFSKFKTFDFYEDNGENLNEFDVKRITNNIQENLLESNLSQNGTPDFYIYFDTKTVENQNNNTLGIGIGNRGIGISSGIPIGGKKLNEKLIIKFIDATTNDLFWEGSLNTSVKENRTPEKRKLHLKGVVQNILKEFPPKK